MASFQSRRLIPHLALGVVVFGLCYGAATVFGHTAAVATVWPVNALVLAYCLRFGRGNVDMAVAVGLALLAMALANIAAARPLLSTLAFPIANGIEIGMALWFMRGVPMPMMQVRDLRQFFLGAVVAGPLAAALISGPVIAVAYGLEGGTLLRAAGAWLLSDMMGMAIVAPLALSLSLVERGQWMRALLAPTAVGIATFILCFQPVMPILPLVFPLVVIAVLRDRDRGAALGIGAVTFAVVAAAGLQAGPVVNFTAHGLNGVWILQATLACMVMTLYPMATLVRRLDAHASEIERDRDAAQADSAAKSRVLGAVGEQIRSPLTGVVTIADMLRSGRLGGLNKRQLDLLTRIAESGAEIEALSRELSALSSGTPPAPRSCSVSEVVERAVDGSRFRARRVGVEIEALPGEATWRAAIDGEHLRRLLSDGIAEALDVCSADGVVRVVAGLGSDDRVEVYIEDSAVDCLQTRLTAFQAPADDGDASGLALDQADLRRLGGDLSLSRGKLGGIRLTLTLPAAENPHQAVRADAAAWSNA